MSGKKVFTGAGEKLASFLINIKNDTINENTLTATLNNINGIGTTSSTVIYQEAKVFSREEVIAYFKRELRKEFNFLKVTDGQKEYSYQKMIQLIYNNTKRIEVITQAQFEALSELVMDELADLYKETGQIRRKFTMDINKLTKEMANLTYKNLDYFVGDEDDKLELHFRTSGNQLLIGNGAGSTNHKYWEVFKCNSKTPVPNQSYIGETLIIGGTEDASPFTKIELTKEVLAKGNITMANGKELIGTALRARYADLAEFYTANMEYRPGTLLQIDTNNQNEVTIWDPSDYNYLVNSSGCIGVVSDKPGLIINEGLISDFPIVPIVLTGQSPIRVIGTINKGDFIYPSLVLPGIAIGISPKDALEYESQNPLINKRIGIALESSQMLTIPEFSKSNQEYLIRVKIN